MSLPPFFDHSGHKLHVHDVEAQLDVLAFQGEEWLSRPFTYRVEFTCADADIAAEKMLGQRAGLSLNAAPLNLSMRAFNAPAAGPLRALQGVITGFKRLSGSVDEAR